MRRFLPLLALLLFVAPLDAQSSLKELASGDAALDREDYKTAQTHYDRALQAASGDKNIEADALHGRGVAHQYQLRWKEASDDLTRSIAINPANAGAFASRAMARKGLGDYSGFLSDAHEAARLNPAQFAQFEEDAKSTALFQRMMMVFLGLGGVVLCLGAYALGRVLIHIIRAEREASRANG